MLFRCCVETSLQPAARKCRPLSLLTAGRSVRLDSEIFNLDHEDMFNGLPAVYAPMLFVSQLKVYEAKMV